MGTAKTRLDRGQHSICEEMKWYIRPSMLTTSQRLNIFGFPNSAALDNNNLGLQDIRAAVEWLRENVAAFGGDPDRMVIWGQSAGSVAVGSNHS